MFAFLLSLSVVSTAVGLLAIGFGIPIHDFSLGNTLIIAGAVGVVGGLVLFGLAAAVRQLRRIADAVGPRTTMANRPQPVVEGAEAVSAPPKQPPGFRPRAPAEAAEAAPTERLPSILNVPPSVAEPPLMAEPVAMPLSGGRSMATPGVRGSAPKPEAPAEARPTPAEITARLSNLAASPPRPAPRLDQQRMPSAAARPADARPRPTQFDTVWPAEVRAVRQSHSEAVVRAPRPDIRPEPRVEAKLEIRPDAKLEPRVEPPPPRVGPAPVANEQRPIAILKSGVIDGMAYTLYTDGSIEAELPQGIMRFASIDELRAHLEKTERQD